MAVSVDQSELIRSATNFLRAAGRDIEAEAVEALTPPVRQRLPTPPPADDLLPIGEAAERLNLSRNAVQRRIEQGMLDGVKDPGNGYRYVTRESVEQQIRDAETVTRLFEFPFYEDDRIDPESVLGQMLVAADMLDQLDRDDE